jgi:tetratricopeptide (TPR) repeat protein
MKPSIALCAFVFSAAVGGIRAQDSTSEQKLREELVSLRQAQEDLRLKLRELELQNRELMVTIREMRLDMQLLAERMRRPAAPISNLEVEPPSAPEAEASKEEARLEIAKVHTTEPEPAPAAAPAPPSEIDAKQKEVADLLKLGIDTANKQRDYAQAVEILSKVIALDPHEHQAFFYRGVAHHYLKHYVEAMADFTTAGREQRARTRPPRVALQHRVRPCGAGQPRVTRSICSRRRCRRASVNSCTSAKIPTCSRFATTPASSS